MKQKTIPGGFGNICKSLKKLTKENDKYKNIEKELGIDLITLFKALTEGFYYTKPHYIRTSLSKGEYEIYFTERARGIWRCRLGWCVRFVGKYNEDDELIPIRCYGKTWALTKEELEK